MNIEHGRSFFPWIISLLKRKTLHGNFNLRKNIIIFHMIHDELLLDLKVESHLVGLLCMYQVAENLFCFLFTLLEINSFSFMAGKVWEIRWEGLIADSIGLKWKSNLYINISWVHSSQWINMDELSSFFWRGQYQPSLSTTKGWGGAVTQHISYISYHISWLH